MLDRRPAGATIRTDRIPAPVVATTVVLEQEVVRGQCRGADIRERQVRAGAEVDDRVPADVLGMRHHPVEVGRIRDASQVDPVLLSRPAGSIPRRARKRNSQARETINETLTDD
jgi:hypothetical protein